MLRLVIDKFMDAIGLGDNFLSGPDREIRFGLFFHGMWILVSGGGIAYMIYAFYL